MSASGHARPWLPDVFRVHQVWRELSDTVTLDIRPVAGGSVRFLPGQFNMLYAFGVGEAAISMSGSVRDEHRYVHTIREVGATSRAIIGLTAGAMLGVRGPFGHGWPMEQALGRDVVVVAGGLGLAPLRPAIDHFLHRREDYGRVVILVGSRNPEAILYRRELEHWRERLDIELTVTVDHADAGWRGEAGVVPALLGRSRFDAAQALAMVCGPEVMMRFTVAALRELGMPPERMYLSMERNMQCATGLCGHCQIGPHFVCRDGPVLRFDRIAPFFNLAEA